MKIPHYMKNYFSPQIIHWFLYSKEYMIKEEQKAALKQTMQQNSTPQTTINK